MAQTKEGALKIAAKKAGVSVVEYRRRVDAGSKRCSMCSRWHDVSVFGRDSSRYDGLSPSCRGSKNGFARATYEPKARVVGRRFVSPRDGDALQARRRINYFVEAGILPHPSSIACSDCGHKGGRRRHEYHHHNGYGAAHHEDVVVLCSVCHRRVHVNEN